MCHNLFWSWYKLHTSKDIKFCQVLLSMEALTFVLVAVCVSSCDHYQCVVMWISLWISLFDNHVQCLYPSLIPRLSPLRWERAWEWDCLTLFPSPAQLLVTCSTKTWGTWGLYSCEYDVISRQTKPRNKEKKFFNQLHAGHFLCK